MKISTHKKKLLEIGKKSIFQKFQSSPDNKMKNLFSKQDPKSIDGEDNGKKGIFLIIF
jgi:hypothetical protein